ncbi:MAG: DUF3024 domain-containing protein [Abditibacteriaceae bacterium]
MSLSEFELKKCEKELDEFLSARRPPVQMRDELDLAYRISGQSVEIFEVTPGFRNPSQKVETPVGKATYIKSQKYWAVYWPKSDMKWHKYSPCPVVESLEAFLKLVDEDKHACFFG